MLNCLKRYKIHYFLAIMRVFYYYLRNKFKHPNNSLMQLIGVHVLSFLLTFLFNTTCYICGCKGYVSWIYDKLVFPSLYPLLLERPWTMITYSFVHKNALTLFWDMLMLYTLGQSIRTVAHSKHIFRLYFLGQTIGALAFFLLYQFSPPFKGMATCLTGPSAAIYAIMVAVCVFIPDLKVNFFFILVQLRYILIFLLIIAFMNLSSNQAGYSLAQLSGALAGYLYAKKFKRDIDRNGPGFKTSSTNKGVMYVRVTKKHDI